MSRALKIGLVALIVVAVAVVVVVLIHNAGPHTFWECMHQEGATLGKCEYLIGTK